MGTFKRTLSTGVTILLLSVVGPTPATAVGIEHPLPREDKEDWRCVEKAWPNFYNHAPVLFQEINAEGGIDIVAFGYAAACKKSGAGVRGGTSANLQVNTDDVWRTDALQTMIEVATTEKGLRAVTEVFEGLKWPGNNAFTYPLPDIPNYFRTMYTANQASIEEHCTFEFEPAEKVCPGIPQALAPVLERYGFMVPVGLDPNDPSGGPKEIVDKYRYRRFLLDTTIKADRALGQWYQSALPNPGTSGNFYATHWGEGMQWDHGTGGVLRIILGFIDFEMQDPEQAYLNPDGTVSVESVLKLNGQVIRPSREDGQQKPLAPQYAWRPKGESDWRPITPTFRQDDSWSAWATVHPTFQIHLTPEEMGIRHIELAINPHQTIQEVNRTQFGDAYLNNIVTVSLVPARPNMKIQDIWIDPGEGTVGGEMFANVAIIHDGSFGWNQAIPVHKVTWKAEGVTYTVTPDVSVEPGTDGTRIALGTFTVKTPGKTKIEAWVNPDHDLPPNEANWNDNYTFLEVPVKEAAPKPVDLEVVSVTAPASQAYSPDGTYTVTWTIRNNSAVTARATRTASFASTLAGAVPGPVATITLGPNESRTETHEIPVFGCGDTTQATVTIAAVAGYVETDRSNNSKSAVTQVTGSCSGGGGGGGDSGYTVIIPADCIPNPDPASNKPCTNYDLTVPNR